MKRRGFLGSVVSLLVGSVIAAKAKEPEVRLAAVDEPVVKQPVKYLASGEYEYYSDSYFISAPIDGPARITYPDGTSEYYTEKKHAELMRIRWPEVE